MQALTLVPPSWWATIFGIFGLLLGSFSNVVRWRVPRRESLLWPGSHCPSCNRSLTVLDLVPVLSWLALRGRCRTCKSRISWQYPAWEAAFGLVGAVAGHLGGPAAGAGALGGFLAIIFAWGFLARRGQDQRGSSLVEALVSVGLIALGLGGSLQALHVGQAVDRSAWCHTQMVAAGQAVLEDLAMRSHATITELTYTDQRGQYAVTWSLYAPTDESVATRLYQADLTVTYHPEGEAKPCGSSTDPAPSKVELSTYIRPRQ